LAAHAAEEVSSFGAALHKDGARPPTQAVGNVMLLDD
jgi:hypothetical protein